MKKIKFALQLFVLLFVISGCEKITDTIISPPDTSETEPLTVMTYNVYLGASAVCLLYTSPSPRDGLLSRMPSSA